MSNTTYVAHANTPEELREELLDFFRKIHAVHRDKVAVPNQREALRQSWLVRAVLFGEVVELLAGLKIEPKEVSNAESN